MVWSCGATAITPLIAALLVLITVRIWTPVAPPPAAATACAASFGGTAAGVGQVASLVNRTGLAWITASSGANFFALAICAWSLVAMATIRGWPAANASSLLYLAAYVDTVVP